MTTPPADRAASRSYLFVPGDRPDRFDKAWTSAADAVILDLEDAVDATRKMQARAAVLAWLSPEHPVLVRINSVDTSWYEDDLCLLQHPGVLGLMVPKAEQLDAALVHACTLHEKCLLPIVESARAFQHLAELASTPRVERLAFGTIDFQVDTGISGDDDALHYFRSRLVLESRLAGLQPPLDGVTADIGNMDVLRADAERSRRFGFAGKLCIHPLQVAIVNEAFSPSAAEIAWAVQVMEAIARSAGAAVAVEGKMVDRPVIMKAQRVLQNRQTTSRRDSSS
ncbi:MULTISPECIES: CoA ester lyase [unclassified Variovorax]|uniref:HpcH/HpaI aldolase/citrate lyase family protein n=1 Tax=unclassified Variovorax TaxID=663243 RepID=UPI002B23550A|nr:MULTISPECIES: CoA ester lyase [unclassified Variovorax]MEB0058453.1 CoA ester lyase [Variovorax sp. LG9.2]MEB0111254.1 CoA ester lyase [Variovorax sp. RTB1]